MVASSFAVAGIEPVEPAAITGCVAAGEALHLGVDQQVAPFGGVDRADFLETLRPIAARDLEEVECELPIRVELVRHQAVEPAASPPCG